MKTLKLLIAVLLAGKARSRLFQLLIDHTDRFDLQRRVWTQLLFGAGIMAALSSYQVDPVQGVIRVGDSGIGELLLTSLLVTSGLVSLQALLLWGLNQLMGQRQRLLCWFLGVTMAMTSGLFYLTLSVVAMAITGLLSSPDGSTEVNAWFDSLNFAITFSMLMFVAAYIKSIAVLLDTFELTAEGATASRWAIAVLCLPALLLVLSLLY